MLHEMATQTQRQQLCTPHHECSKHTHTRAHTRTHTQTDRQADRQTHAHTHRQTDRQTDRHTHTHAHTRTHIHTHTHTHTHTHAHTHKHNLCCGCGPLRFISSLLTAGTHCLSSVVCFATTVKQGGLQRDQNNLAFSHRLWLLNLSSRLMNLFSLSSIHNVQFRNYFVLSRSKENLCLLIL